MVNTSLFSRAGIKNKLFLIALVSALFLSALKTPAKTPRPEIIYPAVKWVLDGDTIIVEGGERVRYAGIDTPEEGEPFYKEAKKRNIGLVRGGRVMLEVCGEKPRDKYGRLLAWVYADGVDVSEVLLKEGLARVLPIPPCGLKKLKEYKSFQKEAVSQGRGIWGLKKERQR
ncbi:MAG: thermonuclease family protein [Deltaproteobacteria bacterium]|nr:thermonuclease family protein [Deltaproteobacteria bacterium]